MNIATLRIKTLEPLMFRGSGEFDPSSRGVYSYASSLYMPRPSTITGALISYFLTEESNFADRCTNINSFNKLLECYKQILDWLGIHALRGPYLYSLPKNIIYVPIRLGNEMLLVDYYQLCYYMLQEHGDLLKSILERDSNETSLLELKYVEKELRRYTIDLPNIRLLRTNTMLRGRSQGASKTAMEGYIYTSEYIAYPLDIELRFKLALSNNSPLKNSELDIALKLGGEHRIARVHLDHKCEDGIDKLFKLTNISAEYYLLLSPMILKGFSRIKYIGLLDTIGLGFSIAKRRRKPLYKALLEGTVIRVKQRERSLRKLLLEYGLYDFLNIYDSELQILARVGYASAIPLIRGD